MSFLPLAPTNILPHDCEQIKCDLIGVGALVFGGLGEGFCGFRFARESRARGNYRCARVEKYMKYKITFDK